MATTTTTSLSQVVLTVYSKEVMFHAQPNLKYAQFATKKTELGVDPGLSIIFTKYNNITKGGALTENVAMGTQALTASQITITVTEYGNAISVSEKLLQSAFDDTLSNGARLLGYDYAVVLDEMLRDTVMGVSNVIYAGGTDHKTVSAKMNAGVLKDAIQYLKENLARPYNGQYWVCFVTPKQGRDLTDDPEFQKATDYSLAFAGEIGRIGNIVFVETTQQPVIKAGTGDDPNANDVHQAVIFGDNVYGFAESLPVEMRDGGIVDFGRTHNLAWYSIMGSGLIEDDSAYIIETL